MTKDFKTDIRLFEKMLIDKSPYALSRNNDGEMIILFDEFIDIRKKLNGEFIYDPKDSKHKFFREKLMESAKYKAKNYYVGIACRCCVGNEKHEKLKKLVDQPEENLTWGNVFVNGNYRYFRSNILPQFNNYKVVVVVNQKANINQLPFAKNIVKRFDVGTNAWMENYSLVDQMKEYIEKNDIKNHLFLFSAGPFSNILILECFKSSSNNTYLDLGSTLDNDMNLGATRGYLWGADTLNKVCIW